MFLLVFQSLLMLLVTLTVFTTYVHCGIIRQDDITLTGNERITRSVNLGENANDETLDTANTNVFIPKNRLRRSLVRESYGVFDNDLLASSSDLIFRPSKGRFARSADETENDNAVANTIFHPFERLARRARFNEEQGENSIPSSYTLEISRNQLDDLEKKPTDTKTVTGFLVFKPLFKYEKRNSYIIEHFGGWGLRKN